MMYKFFSSPAYEVRPRQSQFPPSAFAPKNAYPQHARAASYDTYTTSSIPLPEYMMQPQTYYEVREPKRSNGERSRTKEVFREVKPLRRSKKETFAVPVDHVDPYYYDDDSQVGTPPPPYRRQERYFVRKEERTPPVPRARASTVTSKPLRKPSTKARPQADESKSPRKSDRRYEADATDYKPKQPRKATAEDAKRYGIGPGYVTGTWDPDEEPIVVVGTVFDANSLGKWIYDWVAYYYDARSPMAEHAGELWLCLIEAASKRKRAEQYYKRVKRTCDKQFKSDLNSFLIEGEDIFHIDLMKILKKCEKAMTLAAEDENKGRKVSKLGNTSGRAFVDSMFGREQQLRRTEELMSDLRWWSYRFESDYEPLIIGHSS